MLWFSVYIITIKVSESIKNAIEFVFLLSKELTAFFQYSLAKN